MQFFKAQIKPLWLMLLFAMHVAAGCLHTWIAYRFYPKHGDIWYFFNEGIIYKKNLLADPSKFLSHTVSSSLFNITDSNQPLLDIQYQLLQYLHAILNIFTFNSFYTNTLLFLFLVFAGTMALFKVFYTAYNKPLPAFCFFLLPSVLFWTSVVYKDSLFYMAIGYFFYYLLRPAKSIWWKGFLLLLFTAIMFISRANALITLLPAIFFFILVEKNKIRRSLSFVVVIATVSVAAFIINALLPGGVLQGISERQKGFQLLTGGSRLSLPLLEPTFTSLASIFPTACINGLLQPLPGTGGQIIYTAFSVELLAIWVIVLCSCWMFVRKKTNRFSNFDITCLMFALPGLVIIGYMVPFAGAIVRYRSIYLPFLLAPFLNILCSYPVTVVQSIDSWLQKHVMLNEKSGK